jgi:hypothetical protein
MATESKTVRGSCYCGKVCFEATLPSRFCSHCHCNNCRRAHGAAFVTWVGFKNEQLRVVSGEDQLGHFKTETEATRSFCTTCGTTLFFSSPRWDGETHVALANIDDPIDRKPTVHVYFDRHVPWLEVNDDLKRYGGESGTEKL